jgi:hypothetical protein
MLTKIFSWRQFLILVFTIAGFTIQAEQNQNPTQSVCVGNQEYHVDATIAGATYTWSVSGGGTILSGNGTNTILVNWATPGGPYTLSVFTTVNGCAGPPQSVDITVVEAPTGPTLAVKTPPGPSVCVGTPVSATFISGSGGIDCSDQFEYSFDNSGTWIAYVPGSIIPTTGVTQVDIRGRRAGCDTTLGCAGTPWVILASWTVNTALPVVVTINPGTNPVCAGAAVTYTAGVENGGSSPTYAWRINNGPVVGTLNTYTYIPNAGDVITCEVVSSEQCASPKPATGTFAPTVNPIPNTSNIWHN